MDDVNAAIFGEFLSDTLDIMSPDERQEELDKYARLEADNERLRGAMRQAMEICYRPGRAYHILADALKAEGQP